MKEDALVVSLGDLPQLTRLSIGGMLPFVVQQYLPRWRQLQDLKLVITNAVYDEYDDQHAYALQDFVPLAALTRLTRFVTEVHDELWDEQYSPNDVPPLIITNKAPSGSRPDVSDQLLAYCAAYKGCQQEVTAAMLRQVQEQQQQLARQGRQLEEQQQQLAQQGRQLEEQHAQLAAARVHASQTAELWARVQALEALLLQQK